ncbi:hypothetical protein ACRYCC_38515 [Actinomadura scrupuli]|uniref:hypothetical protein n=1 Tax=Actinomadura scrupuli TaxID=559629 RepID=UPI003D975C61
MATEDESAEFYDSDGFGKFEVHRYSISAFASLSSGARNSAISLLIAPWVILLVVFLIAVWPSGGGEDSYPTAAPLSEGTGLPSSGPESYEPTAEPSAEVSPATSDAATQASGFDRFLDQAAADHQAVDAAVTDIQQCGSSIQNDIAVLDQAAQSRSSLADQVEQADMSEVSGGPEAVRTLSAALRASAEADKAFSAWGTDMSVTCTSRTSVRNSNYKKAMTIGKRATQNKESFVIVWNAIASSYGLQQREPSSL